MTKLSEPFAHQQQSLWANGSLTELNMKNRNLDHKDDWAILQIPC